MPVLPSIYTAAGMQSGSGLLIEVLEPLRELSTVSVLLRLVLAMLFGGMIGLERGKKEIGRAHV